MLTDLSTEQLADLLNFVLCRSRKFPKAEPISVVVVRTWVPKRRLTIEHWCDAKLAEVGILEKPGRRGAGRPMGRSMPHEVEIFFLQQGGRF